MGASYDRKKNDELFLEFKLDNKKQSHIKCEVTVKKVQNNYVGTEFKDKSNYNSDLNYYLLK